MQRNFSWERVDNITENGNKFINYNRKYSDAKLVIEITQAGQVQSIAYYTRSPEVLKTGKSIKGCEQYYCGHYKGPNTLGFIQIHRSNGKIDDSFLVKLVLDIINSSTPLAEIKDEVYAILKINNSERNIVSLMSEQIESLKPTEQNGFKPAMF